MIRVCFYKGCGVVFGEKEPLSDTSITHGLCPKHLEIYLKEIKAEMEKLKDRPGGLKVLIVEDSTLFRQLLSQALNGRFPSIKVYEAIDGEEALQKVEALTPDVILIDLKSSGDNVLDLTKRIRARAPDAAVITLTAYELQQYADLFFSKNSPTAENIFTLIDSILSKCE